MGKRATGMDITAWGDPNEVMPDSGYGTVTFREWCRRECDRINAEAGDMPAMVEERGLDGFIKLVRRQNQEKR